MSLLQPKEKADEAHATAYDTERQQQPTSVALTGAGHNDGVSSGASSFDSEWKEKPQAGIVKAEAARRVIGWQLYVAWFGVALVAYVAGLDSNTSYAYLTAGTTHFSAYQLYASLAVVQQVLLGVLKLPIAKLADVVGRAEAYSFSVLLFVLGYTIVASSLTIGTVFGGVVLQAIGSTGTQIMQQIVIADWVPADWRGLAIGLVSFPYIINFAVASRIVGAICPTMATADMPACSESNGWRWGAGMFCILLPLAASPIILVLALSQRKAQHRGLTQQVATDSYVPASPSSRPFSQRLLSTLRDPRALARSVRTLGKVLLYDFDAVGLTLLVAGFMLILLPLQLHARVATGWNTPYIIGMFVAGAVSLVLAGLWEAFGAKRPIIRRTYLTNRDVIIPTMIGFFDFFSFYCSWTYAFQWVSITFDWSAVDAGYFSNAQSLCLTVFGIAAGAIALATKRYKFQMIFGAIIRMVGIGLMLRYRSADSTTAQIILPQILQGLGGGMLGILLQVSAQVNVPHQDVGMVTAFVLLMTEIGGAVGTAVSGAVQVSVLPDRLATYLPQLTVEQRTAILEGKYATYLYGTPERAGIIAAWSDFMHVLLTIGIVTAAVPLLLTPFLTNTLLTREQNAVGDRRSFHDEQEHEQEHEQDRATVGSDVKAQ